MRSILAYGDSLTWGMDARTGGRHPFPHRWPTRLEAGPGGAARVIAEGPSGRTTAFDDHLSPADRNGARILPTLLESHAPLDGVHLDAPNTRALGDALATPVKPLLGL